MQNRLHKLLKEIDDYHHGNVDTDATYDFIDEFINDGIKELLSVPEIEEAIHAFIFHPNTIDDVAQMIQDEYQVEDINSIPYYWVWDKLTVGRKNDERP